jgi:hypothetical protein
VNLLPNTTISSIGSQAFFGDQKLTGFANASTSSVTSITTYAFQNSTGLTPDGINFASVGGCTATTQNASGVC